VPKQKTKKSVASKYKITGTGKLMHYRAGRRHLLTGKTSKRKRQLRSSRAEVTTSNARTIKALIRGL
jgi:large subunit ribosomal protein L35